MLLVAFFAVWASATDAKRRVLPNKLLGAMAVCAFLCLLVRTLGTARLGHFPWIEALDACLPGPSSCIFLAAIVATTLTSEELVYRYLLHKAGIGFGDVKLITCWTLAIGPWSLIAFALACATGAFWGLLNREKTFPLGPFITFWAISISLGLSLAT